MAYTIPEYVDTTEQAILAVASAVKGEQVTGGDGNVGTALDILADALAGENVTVPMTQQGAILALAQYVGGGGGGGTTEFWAWNSSQDASAADKSISVSRAVGVSDGELVTEPCEVEQVTTTYEEQTIYGVHVTAVPAGSFIVAAAPSGYSLTYFALGYSLGTFPPSGIGETNVVAAPLDGLIVSGAYTLESQA